MPDTIRVPDETRKDPVDVLFSVSPVEPAPVEHHWFVPDETGTYCLACNLPRANRRHVARAA